MGLFFIMLSMFSNASQLYAHVIYIIYCMFYVCVHGVVGHLIRIQFCSINLDTLKRGLLPDSRCKRTSSPDRVRDIPRFEI